MKRIIPLLFLIFLVLAFSFSAFAENDILYPIIKNGQFGFINRSGKVVIAPTWDSVTSFLFDYAMVSKKDDFYVIKKDGSIAAGPMKLSVHVSRRDFTVNPRSFSFGGSIFDCITGKLLDLPEDFNAGVFRDEYADISTNLLLVVGDDKYGYIDRTTGEWAIPPIYDTMSQDWLYGSFFGSLRSETSRAEFRNGYAVVGKDGFCYLINERNERITLPEGYEPNSYVMDGYYTVIGNDYKNIGVADITGKILFTSDKYSCIRLQGDGVAVAISRDKVTFIDINGKEMMNLIQFISYERNLPRLQKGYFSMAEDIELGTALCSIDGELLWYDKNMRILWFDVDENALIAYYNPDEEAGWDTVGNTLRHLDNSKVSDYYEMNSFFYPSNTVFDKESSLSDFDGIWADVFCLQNDEIKRNEYFSEGLQAAAVQTETEGVRYGYIDYTGNFKIEPRYTSAGNFLHGLALIVDENGLQYIDHNGNIVWSEYNNCRN